MRDRLELQFHKVAWALRRTRARASGGISFGANVQIARSAHLVVSQRGDRISIGNRCRIGIGALLATHGGWIEVGDQCTIQPYSVLYGHGGLQIGNFVRIATHCVIIPADHRFADTEIPIALQGETRSGIVIEDDVWIGANVTILDGCRIGRGSVVAAGAVVTQDVPPLSIVAGVPARVVKMRTAERSTVDG
jgi:acetyltransferase-like isoleucine patch superfamily enzyme